MKLVFYQTPSIQILNKIVFDYSLSLLCYDKHFAKNNDNNVNSYCYRIKACIGVRYGKQIVEE